MLALRTLPNEYQFIIVSHVPILNPLNVFALEVIFTIVHKMYPPNKLTAKMSGL